MNGKPSGAGGGSMEAKIEMEELKRQLETKSIKLDELQIQVIFFVKSIYQNKKSFVNIF